MWRVTTREADILKAVLDESGESSQDLLQKKVVLKQSGDSISRSIEELLKGDRISCDEVEAIYACLPSTIEFYKFVDSLVPLSIEETQRFASKSAGNEEQEAVQKARYRARLQKLRDDQENREYMEMTKSIDPQRKYGKVDHMEDFGKEMRDVNRQAIAVLNTLITVGGAFAFGFFGISLAYPHLDLDIATRMLMGLVLGTIVFFADLYFIIKNMDGDFVNAPSTGEKKLHVQ